MEALPIAARKIIGKVGKAAVAVAVLVAGSIGWVIAFIVFLFLVSLAAVAAVGMASALLFALFLPAQLFALIALGCLKLLGAL